ncbi:hypothetical protein QFC20_003384 [Naganishia adeliensis]|uniref:Uncharacterized protein n=1 Tax=Naganishia adeliensis TaxID=92952 RepID=A0ACC2WAK0_9TREE|nr:hypothetical protein QFC20_003384 [Naganishia adeliensis]
MAGFKGEDKTYAIWKGKLRGLTNEQDQCLARMEGEHSYLRREMSWVIADALALHLHEAHVYRHENPDVEKAATFQQAYMEAAQSLYLEKDSETLRRTLLSTVEFVTGSKGGASGLETALEEVIGNLQSPSFKRRDDNDTESTKQLSIFAGSKRPFSEDEESELPPSTRRRIVHSARRRKV